MNGEAKALVSNAMGGNDYFYVPVYQRRYSWTRTQISRLVSDLLMAQRRHLDKYFLGSLILDSTHGMGKQYVIDGQQRLTTISLFLIAIRDSFSHEESTYQLINERYLLDKFNEKSIAKNRLISVDGDEQQYIDVLQNGEKAHLSLFKDNYLYLRQILNDNDMTPKKWLDILTNKIITMVITVQPGDDAQLIFESLNSTGLDLTESDKIRNYLLMSLKDNDQQVAYKLWQSIEEKVGLENLTKFYRSYITSLALSSKITKLQEVYQNYKRYIGNQVEFDRIAQLKVENNIASIYQLIQSKAASESLSPKIQQQLTLLRRLDTDVVIPYLIQVFQLKDAGKLTDNQFLSVLQTLVAYLSRRLFVGSPSNGLDQIFAALNKQVLRVSTEKIDYVEALQIVLVYKLRQNKLFPTDESIQWALDTKDFYRYSQKSFWFVIDALNNVKGEFQDIYARAAAGDFSIEHIMPQHLNQEWQKNLGNDWLNIHNQWVNRLANLTLTGFNQHMSNRSFHAKLTMENGYADSAIKLNRDLEAFSEWNPNTLEQRQKELYQKALVAWPYPKVVNIQEKDTTEWVGLEIGQSETFRKIQSIRFLDDPADAVTNWKQAYEVLVQVLWSRDSSPFYRAANAGNNSLVLYSNKKTGRMDRFLTMPDSQISVKSGWVDTDSRVKMMSSILELCGFSLDDILVKRT